MYEKTILNNGLTVVTYQMPKRVSVSIGIWIKVGARYEKKNINGISHFLEHLLFKGTKRRSCDELKQSIEGIGGSLNGFTTEELTCYLTKVPAKFLSIALDVLWDMVLNANLAAQDIETERRVILEEIKMYKDLPSHFVTELLMKLLWPHQPLGMGISGELESVGSISRNQLLAYKQGFYRLNNIVVIACGNLRHRQLVEECRRHIPSGRETKQTKIDGFVRARKMQTTPQLKFQVKDTEQTHLALGIHGLAKAHPQRFSLWLLHVILGANMSSRLFREVREERGLAYDIGTALKSFQDSGAFVIHAGIDNRCVVEALEVILQQLREIKNTPVDKEELRRAKEYCNGQLMLALEDTSSHMLWLGESIIYMKRFLSPQEIVRRVERVKLDGLNKLANRIFQDCNLNLAFIGPLKERDKKYIKQRLNI
jgi:predicted Zn-dependent peptidase